MTYDIDCLPGNRWHCHLKQKKKKKEFSEDDIISIFGTLLWKTRFEES